MIMERVNNVIQQVSYYEGKIKESMSLSDDLGIDSLRLIELIVSLEETLDITIKEEYLDPDNISTVSDIHYIVAQSAE